MTPPFPFVVGHARSGTTLLRSMLDSHPSLAIPWESYFIPPLWARRTSYETTEGFDCSRFAADLISTAFKFWQLEMSAVRHALEASSPTCFAEAVRAVYGCYAHSVGKEQFGDKTPDYMLQILLIAGVFPEAKFVHIIRDGRDVATSLRAVPWGVRTLREAASSWAFRVGQARLAGKEIGDRYLEVRYEDLVRDPVGALLPICRFTGIEFHESMLSYYQRADEIIRHDPWAQCHSNIFSPPTEGLRDWKRDFTAAELIEFEGIAGVTLQELGYETASPGSYRL